MNSAIGSRQPQTLSFIGKQEEKSCQCNLEIGCAGGPWQSSWLTGLSWPVSSPAWAAPVQAASAPAPGSRVSGTVTAIAGNVLTVKDDKGTESKVTVPDSARVLELPAGAKSLSAATPIKVSDIAVGDRILAKTTPDGSNYTASTVVAMKQADIAKVQQSELQDWKTKGVNGIVKSVDPAAQTVTISTGNGPTAKTIVIQASKTTNIRRYAPDSTKFDDAKPATLDEIKPGDQLRAKGDKNDDGTELTADAIVAGTFRNIAGTVVSVDAAANKVVVNDLATKKPFTVDVNTDSQLHKLSPMMAQGIAMRLKGGAAGAGAPGAAPGGAAGSGAPARFGGAASRANAPVEAPVAGKVVPPAPMVVSRQLPVVRPVSAAEIFSRRSTVRQCLSLPN